MQIGRPNEPFRSARLAVDDDLPVEITVRFQCFSQADANRENAKDNEAGKPEERQQQHRKYAEKKDRQQR